MLLFVGFQMFVKRIPFQGLLQTYLLTYIFVFEQIKTDARGFIVIAQVLVEGRINSVAIWGKRKHHIECRSAYYCVRSALVGSDKEWGWLGLLKNFLGIGLVGWWSAKSNAMCRVASYQDLKSDILIFYYWYLFNTLLLTS